MDTFIYFTFFALVAAATADSGYNYQLPRPDANQNFPPSSQFVSNVATMLEPPYVSQYLPPMSGPAESSAEYTTPGQLVDQSSQYIVPNQQQPVLDSSGSSVSELQHNVPQQQQTIISSNVYIHSAPEETEEIVADQIPVKKRYRIVFVKAPSYNLKFNLNSIKQAQLANEEKTAIYVLAKKPDISNFKSQLSAIQTETNSHKPEVYFVKYKTQAEADRAQQEITAQYDALGGPTNVSDEGFAPVIGSSSLNSGSNFIQSASSNQHRFIQSIFAHKQVSAPSLRYVPVKRK